MNPLLDTPNLALSSNHILNLALSFLTLTLTFYFLSALYNVFFGPLSQFPGPKLWAFSKLPSIHAMVAGDEASAFAALHKQYGPVVRVGPSQLSYAGGAADWKAVYGFRKAGAGALFKDPLFYGKGMNGTVSCFVGRCVLFSFRRRRDGLWSMLMMDADFDRACSLMSSPLMMRDIRGRGGSSRMLFPIKRLRSRSRC